MTNEASSPRETLTGREEIERMLRVNPLTISAVYKTADRVGQGYVLNLSRGGAFFSSDVGFEMGDQFRLRFFLPFQLGPVDAKVQVRWRSQDAETPHSELRSGLGLEFIEIDPEMQDKITQFISKFVELAEPLEL
jgi:c-di-GMP-binding flagellar brake protein YcgR